MSLQEFKDLYSRCFDGAQPSVMFHQSNNYASFENNTFTQYLNIFLFTGQRSVAIFEIVNSSKIYYFPFDSFVNVWDLWNSVGLLPTGKIKTVKIMPQNSLFRDLFFNGSQFNDVKFGSDSVAIPVRLYVSYFVIEYPFTRIIK